MLHDDEINQRLVDYPEPEEVKNIRENIKTSFKDLEFQEGPHKYYVHYGKKKKEELPSVSSVVAGFEQYTDWDTVKERYALKNDLTVDEVTRMWKETNIIATNNGTSTHLFGEMYMHYFQGHPELICDIIKPQYEDGFLIPYSGKQMAAMAYYKEMYDSFYDNTKAIKMYPVMPESQIYIYKDNEFGIKKRYAGTFDILHAYQDKTGKWKLAIHDWKTNASLTNEFARSTKKFMLPPFDDFIDEDLSHYIIQLSLYQIGLMQLGYEIGDRRIIWLKENGTYEKISLPDVTDRLLSVLSQ